MKVRAMISAGVGVLITTSVHADDGPPPTTLEQSTQAIACALQPTMTTADGQVRPVDVRVGEHRCSTTPAEPNAITLLVRVTGDGRVSVEAVGDATAQDLDALVKQAAQEIASRLAAPVVAPTTSDVHFVAPQDQ